MAEYLDFMVVAVVECWWIMGR